MTVVRLGEVERDDAMEVTGDGVLAGNVHEIEDETMRCSG